MTPRHAPGFAVALRFAIAALLLASFGADGATAQATGPRVSLRLPHQMKGSLDPQVLERYAEDPTNSMLERHLYLATPRSLGGGGFMPITQDAPGDDGARTSVGSRRIASTDVNEDGVKDLLLIAHWVRTRS
ncbi:MAG TPA: hypothetical protein VM600_08660, partial [Actinomycetota bacterium]|nr:hypothetical protein [Actinomycetota bacterium]